MPRTKSIHETEASHAEMAQLLIVDHLCRTRASSAAFGLASWNFKSLPIDSE
jgi:hypothetical protein